MAGDWGLVEELYVFLKGRYTEDIQRIQAMGDVHALAGTRDMLRLIQSVYAEAARDSWRYAATIDYFRERAMRFSDHPDFLPEWRIEPR